MVRAKHDIVAKGFGGDSARGIATTDADPQLATDYVLSHFGNVIKT